MAEKRRLELPVATFYHYAPLAGECLHHSATSLYLNVIDTVLGSYFIIFVKIIILELTIGVEPITSPLPWDCSTIGAMQAYIFF